VLHISIWGFEAFSWGLSGDGTEFWAPCDSLGPPQLGVWSAADTALSTSKNFGRRRAWPSDLIICHRAAR